MDIRPWYHLTGVYKSEDSKDFLRWLILVKYRGTDTSTRLIELAKSIIHWYEMRLRIFGHVEHREYADLYPDTIHKVIYHEHF